MVATDKELFVLGVEEWGCASVTIANTLTTRRF
jgi:hypothetical protein